MIRLLAFSAFFLLIQVIAIAESGSGDNDKVELMISVNSQDVFLACDEASLSNPVSGPGDQRRNVHPNAAAACEKLDEIDGDFDNLVQEARPCTKEYNKQDVSVLGYYKGKKVEFMKSYPNPCVMNSWGDGLFKI